MQVSVKFHLCDSTGERAKTIEYRFCDVKSTKQEEMKQRYACVHFAYATRLVNPPAFLKRCGGKDAPLRSKKESDLKQVAFGADYGARTRHLHLGKVALYQMS